MQCFKRLAAGCSPQRTTHTDCNTQAAAQQQVNAMRLPAMDVVNGKSGSVITHSTVNDEAKEWVSTKGQLVRH